MASRRQDDKLATELLSYSILWWSSLGLSKLVGVGGGVSRRMVGPPGVLMGFRVELMSLFSGEFPVRALGGGVQ